MNSNLTSPLIIAVGGLAKNTGKTTALKKIISELDTKKISYLLTGIGYDGETYDLVTGLLKPRFYLYKDNYLLTSNQVLKSFEEQYETIKTFEIKNPLGNIVLVKIKEEGYFLLAGPNRGPDLELALHSIVKDINSLILIDGAINRLVPLSISSKLILSLGASYSTNINYLGKTASALQFLFSLRNKNRELPQDKSNISLVDDEGQKSLTFSSLFTEKALKQILSSLKGNIRELVIPGIFSPAIFAKITPHFAKDATLWLKNPLLLLAVNNSLFWQDFFSQVDYKVTFYQSPELIAFTINPFYPAYEGNRFIPRYLSADVLREKITEKVKIPVFDVLKYPDKYLSDLFL